MKYEEIILHPSRFISLTSLKPEEFVFLLKHFTPLCNSYFRYHTTMGLKRKIITSSEHKSSKLLGSGQKLFFLLVYLKNNPLQNFQATTFDISQPKVSKITEILLPILDDTLKKLGFAPTRDGAALQKLLDSHAEKVFSYDGMERQIQRNISKDAQEIEYSGKKKRIL